MYSRMTCHVSNQIAEHAEKMGRDDDYAEYRDEVEQELQGYVSDKISLALRMGNMETLNEVLESYNVDLDEMLHICRDRVYRNGNDRQSHTLSEDIHSIIVMRGDDRKTCDRLAREFSFWLDYTDAVDAEIARRDELAAEKAAGI